MPFELTRYLERVGLAGCHPDFAGLEALQRAQMSSIAFEDIEPYLGQVPDLSPEAVWSKLVLRRRGGYCFELNGLLGEALKGVGFAARPILARVRMGAAIGGIRAHLAWIVSLEGSDWLVDAGFGGPGPYGLLSLSEPNPQYLPNGVFRLRMDETTGEILLERQTASGWFSLFGFDETPFTPADIEGANYLCACSPVQPFRENLMMSMHRPDGYVSLMNRNVKFERINGIQTSSIDTLCDLKSVMTDHFGLNYGDATLERTWARLERSPAQAA